MTPSKSPLAIPAYKKSAKTGTTKAGGITFKTTSGTSQPSPASFGKLPTGK